MNSRKDLFKEQRNLLDSSNPPKSLFTIELEERDDLMFNKTYPFHFHDWYELYYLQDGSCTYHLDKKSYLVNKGDWIFIPPKAPHKVLYHSGSHQRCLIYFSKDYIPPEILPHIDTLIADPIFSPSPAMAGELDSADFLAQKILAEFKNSTEFSTALIKCYLLELFVLFLTKPKHHSDTAAQKDSDIRIRNVIDYINLHYAENITLESLSSISDTSINWLSKKFKLATGVHISEYIRLIRIKQAKILLLETNDSVSQIAYKCGFNDSNYFSYIFKQSENVSPLKYRKSHS